MTDRVKLKTVKRIANITKEKRACKLEIQQCPELP